MGKFAIHASGIATAVLLFCLTVTGGTPARASEESERLVGAGVAALEAGDVAGGTALFIDAYEADPTDPVAAFYVGVGMNRAGDPVQAIAALDEAERLGFNSPELDFEAGWALLVLGQYDMAIVRLEAFEAAMPGRAKTSEFLGRAWLAKGHTATARAYFDEAIARDPGLRSSVEFQLAAIEVSEGDPDAAAAYLDSIVQNDPTSPLGQYLGDRLRRIAETDASEEQKIWSLVASFAVGHDSNAIALGEAVPLPANITNQSGSFVESAVTGSVLVFSRPGTDQLVANASAAMRRYGDNLTVVDSESFVAGLDYQAVIRSDLVGRLQGFLGTNLNHGNTINRFGGLRGSVQFESFDVTWEPWVGVTYVDYNESGFVAPADQRSGPVRSAGLNATWWWDAIEADLLAGVAYTNTETKGTNFDSQAWSAVIGLSKELSDEVVADLSFAMINTDYENLDTRATPPGTFKRSDQTRVLSLQLSKPVWGNLTLFGRFNMTSNGSNISSFDYTRVETLAGVAASF